MRNPVLHDPHLDEFPDDDAPASVWRAWCAKLAAEQGLESEVLEMFDQFIAGGDTPYVAAIDALYEWDI